MLRYFVLSLKETINGVKLTCGSEWVVYLAEANEVSKLEINRGFDREREGFKIN